MSSDVFMSDTGIGTIYKRYGLLYCQSSSDFECSFCILYVNVGMKEENMAN